MISWKKHYKRSLIALSVLFSAGAFMNAQTGDAKAGEKLFKANCSSCHALDKKLVGPALGGVVERLKKDQNLDTTWIKSWVKNNEKLRASGDKYANEVYNANGKTAMTVFEGKLQDGDIDNILAYTSNPPPPPVDETAAAATASNGAAPAQSGDNKMVVIGLLAIAGLLVWILLKLKQLVKLQASEELSELTASRVQTFGEIYEKYNKIFKALQALLALFAGYAVWNALMSIGVYQGYKPEQPIYFSHKIHAGENKIDCQLCHSSAKYGKVSEIPSVNVCMNCHRNIPEYKGKYIEPGKSREFYTGEIKKIYEAAGWDENKQAYTGKTKAIEWTRIHNMQDFVYFNHAQHVVAGEATIKKAKGVDVVCKACHGKIDTMNVVQMANPFTMGWCIECHRTTEVDMSNGYNKEYFQTLHNKVKKQYGNGTKMTVDAIGGIECGKCHY